MAKSHHKCEFCDKDGVNRAVEMVSGKPVVKYLCDEHAAAKGLKVQATPGAPPINELLSSFMKAQSGQVAQSELTCGTCGMTFSQFREASLVGCPECYRSFESPLTPLIERAHEGGSHHIGKAPRRAGTNENRQALLAGMQRRLGEAVAAEDYELAARLRDEIRRLQEPAR